MPITAHLKMLLALILKIPDHFGKKISKGFIQIFKKPKFKH